MRIETRLYAELNEFLAPERQGRPLVSEVAPGTSVKDLVESLGVPHTEIDVLLVNGHSVDFSHRLTDGDRVSVYPMFEAIDVSPIVRLRPAPLREPRFVVDVHLGRLARYLRLLGFDTVWANDAADDELVRVSLEQRRILLTRDRGILKRRDVTHGHFVYETQQRRQITEVLRRFDLRGAVEPFTRCLECNGVLEPVQKAEVEDRLPPRTRRDYDEFRRCRHCGRIYWKGSHFDALQRVVDDIVAEEG